MAADKKIMAEIETLRLDRPGRVYQALIGDEDGPPGLVSALGELARTYREEADLWSRSGAKGWKGSEAELYTVATHIDVVATQLDNAGGGAALSVSEPKAAEEYHIDESFEESVVQLREARELEAELRESAKRIDALQRTGASGLDALIADSVRERRGHVRDEFLDPGSPARSDADTQPERKTAHQWNADPRVDPYVISWSDFGSSAHRLGMTFSKDDPITLAEFERARDGGAVTVASRIGEQQADGTLLIDGEDVSAYLSGEVDTLPGLAAALVPSSVTDATGIDKFALEIMSTPEVIIRDCQHMLAEDEDPAPWCDCRSDDDMAAGHPGPCKRLAHLRADHDTPAEQMSIRGIADTSGLTDEQRTKLNQQMQRKERTSPIGVPKTWESESMTADGLRKPGTVTAPLLGQPGDAGSGYSHTYVPAGGRVLRFDELLTPVPAAALPPHLSHSQIGDVGDCGVQYRLQRVDKLPQVPQWANIGGSAFHAAVEAIERTVANMGDRTTDGQPMSWANYDTELVWKHHFEEQIRIVAASSPVPISVWRASRKGAEGRAWWEVNGPLMLRRYLDKRPIDQSVTIDSGGTPAIEWEIMADVPTPYGPVSFKAVLDRVTVSPLPGTIIIRDYKSSYERPTDTTQLGEYAWVLVLGGHVPAGVTVLGTYFDARRGEWTEPVDLLATHPFEAFQYRVTAAHGQKRALTVGPTPARPSSYCGGCSVRYACPVMNQLAAVAPVTP